MTKYWRGRYVSCPQTNYWGTCPPVPRFRRLWFVAWHRPILVSSVRTITASFVFLARQLSFLLSVQMAISTRRRLFFAQSAGCRRGLPRFRSRPFRRVYWFGKQRRSDANWQICRLPRCQFVCVRRHCAHILASDFSTTDVVHIWTVSARGSSLVLDKCLRPTDSLCWLVHTSSKDMQIDGTGKTRRPPGILFVDCVVVCISAYVHIIHYLFAWFAAWFVEDSDAA